MQKNLDIERNKIIELEGKTGNILEKLIAYEVGLRELVKESGQQMEMIITSLCVATVSLDKRSNEKIISPMHTKMSGGPNRRIRHSTKRAIEAAPVSVAEDLFQGISNTAKDLTKVVEELQ